MKPKKKKSKALLILATIVGLFFALKFAINVKVKHAQEKITEYCQNNEKGVPSDEIIYSAKRGDFDKVMTRRLNNGELAEPFNPGEHVDDGEILVMKVGFGFSKFYCSVRIKNSYSVYSEIGSEG